MSIYLDHAATSPLRPEVRDLIFSFYNEPIANPSGKHEMGRHSRRILDDSREKIASCFGARPSEVIFTSGGTESNNLAIFGTLSRAKEGGAVLISQVEHRAVLNTAEIAAKRSGRYLRVAPVDSDGVVRLESINNLVDETVRIVSIMASNNEIGTIEPIEEIAKIVRKLSPDAIIHTDAVQGAHWLDIQKLFEVVDMMSISAHKLGGPVGVGALLKKDSVKIDPIIHGGGQERELRSGTNDVVGAAALAKAVELLKADNIEETRTLKNQLADGLMDSVENIIETVPRDVAVPGLFHILVPGVAGEELLYLLDKSGVCVSAGSACASGSLSPSHVLMAVDAVMDSTAAIRLSLGWSTTRAEIDEAIDKISDSISNLRKKSTVGI